MIDNMKKSCRRNKARIILCVCLMTIMAIFSFAYAARQADHDCDHEDCAICRSVSFCMDKWEKQTLSVSFAVLSVMAFLCISKDLSIPSFIKKDEGCALDRIRMNN